MGIRGHMLSSPAPTWLSEFENSQEWATYVQERYFGALIPGEPFLIVMRELRHDSTGHTSPSTWMNTAYYLGVLSDDAPASSIEADDRYRDDFGVRINALRTIGPPGIHRDRKSVGEPFAGSFRLDRSPIGYGYTPYTEPFVPPFVIGRDHSVFGKEVDAISVACGMHAINEATALLALYDNQFMSWYVRGVMQLQLDAGKDTEQLILEEKRGFVERLLRMQAEINQLDVNIRNIHGSVGIPRYVDGAISLVTDEACARLMSSDQRRHLKEKRDAIERNLAFAVSAGMDTDFEHVLVNGIRYQPAILIEDFRTMYGLK